MSTDDGFVWVELEGSRLPTARSEDYAMSEIARTNSSEMFSDMRPFNPDTILTSRTPRNPNDCLDAYGEPSNNPPRASGESLVESATPSNITERASCDSNKESVDSGNSSVLPEEYAPHCSSQRQEKINRMLAMKVSGQPYDETPRRVLTIRIVARERQPL